MAAANVPNPSLALNRADNINEHSREKPRTSNIIIFYPITHRINRGHLQGLFTSSEFVHHSTDLNLPLSPPLFAKKACVLN